MEPPSRPPLRRRIVRLAICVLVPFCLVAGLTGLYISSTLPPVTTTKSPDGTTRIIRWSSYPGVAGLDPEQTLNAPDAAAIERDGLAMVAQIQDDVTAKFGYRWHDDSATEPRRTGSAPNSYGGTSMLTTLKSASRHSEGVPTAWSDKQQILVIATRAAAQYGFGIPHIDWNVAQAGTATRFRNFGGTTPQSAVIVGATSMGENGQWLSVDFTDLSKDTRGRFTRKSGAATFHADSVAIRFGANCLLAHSDRARFMAALKPFAGLVQPESLNN